MHWKQNIKSFYNRIPEMLHSLIKSRTLFFTALYCHVTMLLCVVLKENTPGSIFLWSRDLVSNKQSILSFPLNRQLWTDINHHARLQTLNTCNVTRTMLFYSLINRHNRKTYLVIANHQVKYFFAHLLRTRLHTLHML